MIYLRLQPGAKPNVQMIPFEDDPPDVTDRKLKNFLSSYAVHVKRNTHFSKPFGDGSRDVSSSANPPEFECTIDNSCRLTFGINGRMAEIGGEGEALESYQLVTYNQKNKIASPAYPDGVPKCHAKLDPTQALLNSFILTEDSPEAKKYFK